MSAEPVTAFVDDSLVNRPRHYCRGVTILDQIESPAQSVEYIACVIGVQMSGDGRGKQPDRQASQVTAREFLSFLPGRDADTQSQFVAGLPQQLGVGDGDEPEFGIFTIKPEQDFRADPGRFAGCDGQYRGVTGHGTGCSCGLAGWRLSGTVLVAGQTNFHESFIPELA